MNKCTNVKQNDNFKIVSVLNYGAFLANVDLYYSIGGEEFHFQKYGLAVLQEFKVNIPSKATNVFLKVFVEEVFEEYLLFDVLYSVAKDACFLLWGLSFAAQYKQIPCTGLRVIQNILPPGVIISPQSMTNNVCSKCNDKCLYIETKSNINSLQNNNCNIETIRVESKDIY